MATDKNEKDPKKVAEERLKSDYEGFSGGANLPEGEANTLNTDKPAQRPRDDKDQSPAGEKWTEMKNPPKPENGFIQKDKDK